MASSVRPSSKCIVTITGCSFIVTVQAPNAPCRQTNRNSSVGNQGRNLSSVRPDLIQRRHAITISVMISTPTAIAR